MRIALDDFGTGYSSLSYLQRFPFDKIKIDRCFVNDLAEAGGSSIVQAVVNIAAARHMTTTAEGVETNGSSRNCCAHSAAPKCRATFSVAPKPAAEVREILFSTTSARTAAVAAPDRCPAACSSAPPPSRTVDAGAAGIDGDATQQVVGGGQRLVVLLRRRHVGLRAVCSAPSAERCPRIEASPLISGAALQFVRHILQHLDVGHDTLRLDRSARRREVARGGERQRAMAGTERDDGLHRALAERTGADQGRPLVIMQGAGHDLRGGCRTAVDQNDERLALGEIAAVRREALGFLGPAAPGRDHLAARQERARDRDGLIEQSAGIVAEVEHIAGQALRRNLFEMSVIAFFNSSPVCSLNELIRI